MTDRTILYFDSKLTLYQPDTVSESNMCAQYPINLHKDHTEPDRTLKYFSKFRVIHYIFIPKLSEDFLFFPNSPENGHEYFGNFNLQNTFRILSIF